MKPPSPRRITFADRKAARDGGQQTPAPWPPSARRDAGVDLSTGDKSQGRLRGRSAAVSWMAQAELAG
jgi:hypothetical protein